MPLGRACVFYLLNFLVFLQIHHYSIHYKSIDLSTIFFLIIKYKFLLNHAVYIDDILIFVKTLKEVVVFGYQIML